MRFNSFRSEDEKNIKLDYSTLENRQINEILDEFRIRAEIFLLFAYKTFNLIDFPKKAEANIRVFEDRVLEYLKYYDVIAIEEAGNLG